MITLKESERLKQLPPYLFVEIDRLKREALRSGTDVIDLGVGDPDRPTLAHIVEALYQSSLDPRNHRYALDAGLPQLRQTIAKWMKARFGVTLDPDEEILPLIGSKEGIAHMPLAFVNPGDVVLVPDPGYPPYRSAAIFAGGIPYSIPLLEGNGYFPDLEAVDLQMVRRAKLLYLNYPNNPTAATAEKNDLKRAVDFCLKRNILICHDAAYSEITYDGYRAPSIFEVEGARACAVEFHSLSKTHNMTGWRIGFAAGDRSFIGALAKVKANIDSGIFQAVQFAGIAALEGGQEHVDESNRIYEERRNVLVDGLNRAGWSVPKPKATFYVWAPVPPGYTSNELAQMLLKKAGVVTTPGVGFGAHGEGYVRMALTVSMERLEEAVERIRKMRGS
ncbi:MAG: LL-diaminopimelate aminotransferase [Candidatus Omnitrophica bacterium]|nr:LL-diaminopimelate aminotransferase [Candidatus Omnitrophota bacterium]